MRSEIPLRAHYARTTPLSPTDALRTHYKNVIRLCCRRSGAHYAAGTGKTYLLPRIDIEEFYSYLRSVRRPNTALKYKSGAERFLSWLAKHAIRFDRMPPNVLSLYAEYLTHSRLKPASVSVFVAAAKKYIAWSNSRGTTNVNVHMRIDLPRPEKLPPNSLKQDHILAFLALASRLPEPRRTALLILPYCGLRTHELATLQVSSISQIEATLNPRASAKPATYLCFTFSGKGGTVRTVPILLDGVAILVNYLKNWRRHIRNKKLLFVDAHGSHISERTMRADIARIRDQLKVQRLTLHTLRRTYLTTLQKAGVDLATLTKIAGHKSFSTTLNHYLEIEASDIVGSIDRVGARLVARGEYADQIKDASSNVLDFLKSREHMERIR